METPAAIPLPKKSIGRGINYLGALGAKLRDLQGFATLAFELIQNADDAPGATQIRFNISDFGVVVENDGEFSDCGLAEEPLCVWPDNPSIGHMCDFHRFRNVSSGDKREQTDTAGAFGVGFTAVYQITDRPELMSHGRHWLVYEENPESERIKICGGCDRCSDNTFRGTRFYLPWANDPNSDLRHALRAPAVLSDSKEQLIAELKGSAPEAMLFLKQLNRVEVFEGTRRHARFERLVVDDSVLINDGQRDSTWHIISTDFDLAASSLRSKWAERIEKKRTARVRLAIPADAIRTGLLCAYLPTQQETGLPFHINADFFTQSDRKTVILESDYQSEWNRAALHSAAQALASSLSKLPGWLGSERAWQIVDAIFTAHTEARDGKRDRVFQIFWDKVATALANAPIAESTEGELLSTTQVLTTYDTEEQDAVPILTALGLKILRPELRRYIFHLPSRAGVQVLDIAQIVSAFRQKGLTQCSALATVPAQLSVVNNRKLLFGELERLIGRKKGEEQKRAIEAISTCALFLADDGQLWPAKDIYVTDAKSASLISKICPQIRFSNSEVHGIATTVASAIPWLSASAVIAEILADRFALTEEAAPSLLLWFETHKGDLENPRELKARLAALPIFPSAAGLKALQSLALTGGDFIDPVGVTELLDLRGLQTIRQFFVDLGARELTFERYASTYLPKAIRSGAQLTLDKVRALTELLATRSGEIRDNVEARSALASLELVECSDGKIRRPAEVYFACDIVTSVLGSKVATAKLPSKHRESVSDLYRWLGVAPNPRLEDIVHRVTELSKQVLPNCRQQVEDIVKHLGDRLRTYEELPTELLRLRQLAWLPARGVADGWFAPKDIYVTFREYLFGTQARFLDLSKSVQQSSVHFLRLIGTQDEPTVAQVVNHLLTCAASHVAVNREVYGFLNEHASDKTIGLLLGKPCLMLADGKYIDANHVFWNSQPFGRFRSQLGTEHFKYSDLLNRMGVRQSPTADDAVAVLREISSEYGSKNTKLDEHAHDVAIICWTLLTSSLDKAEISEEALRQRLGDEKVVPAPNGILERPSRMFFEDRTGLSAKFHHLLSNNVIRCPEGAWQAMAMAGVKFLSSVISSRIVDVQNPTLDTTLSTRFKNRRIQLSRVLDPIANGNAQKVDLDVLASIHCYSTSALLIQFSIDAFNKHEVSQAEEVKAHFDADTVSIYFVPQQDEVPWAAIARELSSILSDDSESGRVALALMQVLSAPDLQNASALLDELGFPPVEQVDVDIEPQDAISDFGTEGEEAPAPPPPPPPSPVPADSAATGTTSKSDSSNAKGENSDSSEHSGESRGHGQGYGGKGGEGERPKADGSKKPHYAKRSKFRTYVVPEGAEPTEGEGGHTKGRSEVDEAGVQHVYDFEVSKQRVPTVMPHENPGFDVISKDADGFIARYIEVKSCSGEWDIDGVAVSKTQFEDAQTHGDIHWLYVVEKANSPDFSIFRIQDPARRVTEFLYDDGWRAVAEPDNPTPLEEDSVSEEDAELTQ